MPAAAPNISHVTLPVRPAVCCRPKISCTTCTSSARAQVLHGSCTDLAQVLHGAHRVAVVPSSTVAGPSRHPVRSPTSRAARTAAHFSRRTARPFHRSSAPLLHCFTAPFSAVSGRRPLLRKSRPLSESAQSAKTAKRPVSPPLCAVACRSVHRSPRVELLDRRPKFAVRSTLCTVHSTKYTVQRVRRLAESCVGSTCPRRRTARQASCSARQAPPVVSPPHRLTVSSARRTTRAGHRPIPVCGATRLPAPHAGAGSLSPGTASPWRPSGRPAGR